MRINEEFIDRFGDDVIQNQDTVEVDDSERQLPYLFLFEGTECNKNKKLPEEYIRRLIRFHSMACKVLNSNPYVKVFIKHFNVYVGASTDYANETYAYKVTDDITALVIEYDAKIDKYSNTKDGYFNSFYDYLASKRPCRPSFAFYIDANVSSIEKISKLMLSLFESFSKCYNMCFKDLGSYVSILKHEGKRIASINSSTIEFWKKRPIAEMNMFANSYIAFNPDCSMKDAKRMANDFCSPKDDEQLIKNYLSYFNKKSISLIDYFQKYLNSNMEMIGDTLVIRPQRQYYIWAGRPHFISIYEDWIRFVYDSYKKNLFKIKIEGLEYAEIHLGNKDFEFSFRKSEETIEKTRWFIENILSDDIKGIVFNIGAEVCCQYMNGKMNLVEMFPSVKEIHVGNDFHTSFVNFWEERFIDIPVIKKKFEVDFIT